MLSIYENFKKLSPAGKLIPVFLLAFLIRLAANIVFQGINSPPNPNMGADHLEYDLMARILAQGQGLSLEYLRRPPGVAFLMFPIYYFFGIQYMLMRIFFCLLGAATCIAVFFIGKKLCNTNTGLLASFILCIYPMHFYYSMHFLSEVPWAFFMSIAVFYILLFEENNKIIYGIFAGFFIGFSAFIRPTALWYLPFYILLSFVSYFFKDRKKFLQLSLIPLLSMLFFIMPWVMRNYSLTGHFILVSTHAGRTFWAANNEAALNNPKIIGGLVSRMSDSVQVEEFKKYKTVYEQDMAAYRYGIQFIKSHLKDMPKLELMKIYRLLTPFYNTPNRLFNLVGGLSWAFLSIFVFWGIINTFINMKFNPLHSAMLLILFSTLVFYGDHRFREAISPFLAVYASLGITQLVRLFERKNVI
jgi:4-amino-4-deoxy-L-arabinose transferase-like glycosyltransferase